MKQFTANDIFITNGYTISNGGGLALYGSEGNVAILNGVSFVSNSAGTQGGALYLSKFATTMSGCIMTDNKAASGAAIYAAAAKLDATSTVISSNTASGNGDGVYLYYSDASFVGSLFAGQPRSDVYNPTCSSSVKMFSKCNEGTFNPGVDSLLYSCDAFPADLSGDFCMTCPVGQYSCCGALSCSSQSTVCTDEDESICP